MERSSEVPDDHPTASPKSILKLLNQGPSRGNARAVTRRSDKAAGPNFWKGAQPREGENTQQYLYGVFFTVGIDAETPVAQPS